MFIVKHIYNALFEGGRRLQISVKLIWGGGHWLQWMYFNIFYFIIWLSLDNWVSKQYLYKNK